MIKAILFDLDGTLIDTAGDFTLAVNNLREESKQSPIARKIVSLHVNNGLKGIAEGCLEASSEQIIESLAQHYANVLGMSSVLFEGIYEVLEHIKSKGLLWGIVTNKQQKYTVPLIQDMQLLPDVLVCGDTFEHAKPHPMPLLKAAESLGVKASECLMVGDGERDIIAARAAAMPSIAAAYGYLGVGEDPKKWGTDTINSPIELLHYL